MKTISNFIPLVKRPSCELLQASHPVVREEARIVAHEMVIAAINFGGNEAIESILRTGLTFEHLEEVELRIAVVFRAAGTVADSGQLVNVRTVYHELRVRSESEKVGAPPFLVDLPEGMPLHAGNVQFRAEMLFLYVEKHREARHLREQADALERDACEPLLAQRNLYTEKAREK